MSKGIVMGLAQRMLLYFGASTALVLCLAASGYAQHSHDHSSHGNATKDKISPSDVFDDLEHENLEEGFGYDVEVSVNLTTPDPRVGEEKHFEQGSFYELGADYTVGLFGLSYLVSKAGLSIAGGFDFEEHKPGYVLSVTPLYLLLHEAASSNGSFDFGHFEASLGVSSPGNFEFDDFALNVDAKLLHDFDPLGEVPVFAGVVFHGELVSALELSAPLVKGENDHSVVSGQQHNIGNIGKALFAEATDDEDDFAVTTVLSFEPSLALSTYQSGNLVQLSLGTSVVLEEENFAYGEEKAVSYGTNVELYYQYVPFKIKSTLGFYVALGHEFHFFEDVQSEDTALIYSLSHYL